MVTSDHLLAHTFEFHEIYLGFFYEIFKGKSKNQHTCMCVFVSVFYPIQYSYKLQITCINSPGMHSWIVTGTDLNEMLISINKKSLLFLNFAFKINLYLKLKAGESFG